MLFNRHNHRFRLTSVGIVTAGAVAAGTFAAANPSVASAAAALVQTVTCSVSGPSACITGTNTGSGIGVSGTGKSAAGVRATSTSGYGLNATSSSNDGVFGQTSTGAAGVVGTAKSTDGVYGYTTGGGTGVFGNSLNGYGLYGSTTTGSGYGVVGSVSGTGTGVYGASGSSYGVEGLSSSGYALYGDAYGSGTAGYLSAAGGGYGLISYTNGSGSGVALYGSSSHGNAADVTGTYIGIVARAPAGGATTFPIVATDTNSNDLFYVDDVGNVSYHGGLFKFSAVRGGVLKSFSPSTTAPTVEDTGTAQLVAGAAVVRLDPMFAASIDGGSSYRVFVTPNGDTRGLFVGTKTPSGFVVRESQGGRSTVSFDYRIVATAAGQRGQRMALANPAAEPLAAMLHPALPGAAAPLRVTPAAAVRP